METQNKTRLPVYGGLAIVLVLALAIIALFKINTQAGEIRALTERMAIMEGHFADLRNSEREAADAKAYATALARQTQQLTARVAALEAAEK